VTRTLVVRLDNAGDVLLAGPAVRAIAASSSRVLVLCGPRGRPAAELLPGVDAIVEFDAPWIADDASPFDPHGWDDVVRAVRGLSVDRAAVLTSFHQSSLPAAILLRLAGVGEIAAPSVDFPGSLLDHRLDPPDHLHEVERGLHVVAALGASLPVGDDGRLAVVDALPPAPFRLPEFFVALCPGASVPARSWAAERYAELAARLESSGRPVVVCGGPAEESLTRAIASIGRASVDLGGRTSLGELASVLRRADVVVTGNSGPSHLAAAVGTPVVCLFAPTVPSHRWRPWKVPHLLLGREDIACAGCRARVCPVPGHPCIDEVSAADVVAAVEELCPVRAPTVEYVR